MNVRLARLISIAAILSCGLPFPALAAARLGRAVIAGVEGKASVESPDGTFDVQEGLALSHGRTITTEANSSVCALLTPGALLCIHADSKLELTDIQHVIEGLPGDGGAEKGRVTLYLERGAMLVNGLKSAENLALTINIQPGVVLQAAQAEFVVARNREGWQIFVEEGTVALQNGDAPRTVNKGQTLQLVPPATPGSDAWGVAVSDGLDGESAYSFYVCRQLFPSLAPLAQDWSWEALGEGASIATDGARIAYLTRALEALDVSPTTRDPSISSSDVTLPVAQPRAVDGGVRRRVEMWQWYRSIGEVRGVNYVPRTAVNPTAMWQAETFDRGTIDQELAWAHDSGFNSVRVFLPFLVWEQSSGEFKQRFTEFLKLADSHDLTVVPVLFDDYSPHGIEPYLGAQRDPVPNVHNSQWTPSPGHARVTDRNTWPALEKYVKDLVGSFSSDSRVLFWDLYNDPGRSGLGDQSVPLVQAAFEWARATRPSQPLTAGVNAFLGTPGIAAIMRQSDLVTFSGYQSRAELEGGMAIAGLRGRPVVCTGWLDRTQDLTFDATLPLFAQSHVGWYQWGLVAGQSQLQVPPAGEGTTPDLWAQALLKADGQPYDEDEIRLIQQFRFEER